MGRLVTIGLENTLKNALVGLKPLKIQISRFLSFFVYLHVVPFSEVRK